MTGEGSSNRSLDFITGVKLLRATNNFSGLMTLLSISGGANQPATVVFNSLNNKYALLSGGPGQKAIAIKELAIDYQLQTNVDKKGCDGLVKFDNGCVLFNERSTSGSSGPVSLEKGWDPFQTVDGMAPTLCTGGSSCMANQLIKVRPDRFVLNGWTA